MDICKFVFFTLMILAGNKGFAQNENAKEQNCFNYSLQGACEKALKCFESMSTSKSGNEIAIAISSLAVGKFETAIENYWVYHEQLDDTLMFLWDGVFMLSEGKYEGAIEQFNEYYKIDTTHIWCQYLLGLCYNQLGDTASAMRHYWEIRLAYKDTPPIQLVGSREYAFLQAAEFYCTELEMPLVSRILFANVLKQHSDNKDALFGVATILSDAGDYHEVIRLLEPITNSTDDKLRVYNILGRAYRNIGENYTALSYYKRALDMSPNDVIVLNNLAVAYRTMGDYVMALHFYSRALANDSSYVTSIYGAGVTYCFVSKFDSAKVLLDQLGQVVNTENEFYGKLYHMIADSLTLRDLREDPANPMVYYRFARMCVRYEDYYQAEIAIRKAIDLGCQEPNVHSWYAALLFAVIKPEEAVQHLEKWKDHEIFGPSCREFIPEAKIILDDYRTRNK